MSIDLYLEEIRLPADWSGWCYAKTEGPSTSLYVSRIFKFDPVSIASGDPTIGDLMKAMAVALSDAWRTGYGLCPKPDVECYEVPFGVEAPIQRRVAQQLLLNRFGAAPLVTFLRHVSEVARDSDPLLEGLVRQRGHRNHIVEYQLLDHAGKVVAADVDRSKALRTARSTRLSDRRPARSP